MGRSRKKDQSERDYYYGHQTTDITRQCEFQIPTHSEHPDIKNAPSPYYILPHHDLSEKFRNKLANRRTDNYSMYYHGRIISDITDPTRYKDSDKGIFLGPWPQTSVIIGDPNFTRYEYLNPLGRPKPGPMDDYVPIARDKNGRVTGTVTPPPSRVHSRRRMLGLPINGCHRPGSPCRYREPGRDRESDRFAQNQRSVKSYRSDENCSPKDDDDDDSSDWSQPQDSPRKGVVKDNLAIENTPSPRPPYTCCSRSSAHGQRNPYHDERAETPTRPETLPEVRTQEEPQARGRKKLLGGDSTEHGQPVGGRLRRNYLDDMEERGGAVEPATPDSSYSYQSRGDMPDRREDSRRPQTVPGGRSEVESPENSKPRGRRKSYLAGYGSNTLHMQPVGGRPQRTHHDEMEERARNPPIPGSPYSYQSRADEGQDMSGRGRKKYSLGDTSLHAQPVGGRPQHNHEYEREEPSRDPSPPYSVSSESATTYRRKSKAREDFHGTSPAAIDRYASQNESRFPKQRPVHSSSPTSSRTSRRPRESRREDDNISYQSRKSIPPEHNPNLPPERDRGRDFKRGNSNRSGGDRGGCKYHRSAGRLASADLVCKGHGRSQSL